MSNEERPAHGGKNNYLIVVIVAVVVGIGGFFGGMKYQESKTPEFIRRLPTDFQEKMGQFGQRGQNQRLRPVSGEILSNDSESLTIKLPDASSKIILLTETSVINKTEEGSSEDLSEGSQVVVIGQENPDGSITAQNIQIGKL